MITFKNILQESIDQDRINWWSTYAKRMIFASEEEARKWIVHNMKRWVTYPNPVSSLEQIEKDAFEIPLYQSGKSWKVGKRIQIDRRFSWSNINIEPNSLEELETAGYINMFDVESMSSIKMISISKIIPTEDHAVKEDKEEVLNYAKEIKNGKVESFKAIVIDDTMGIIDGHHRYYAIKLLKMKNIPAQIIK